MKTIEINHEESVAIHNAVIFMANDLMEEIQDLEAYIKDKEEKSLPVNELDIDDLKYKKRRWDMLLSITEKVK